MSAAQAKSIGPPSVKSVMIAEKLEQAQHRRTHQHKLRACTRSLAVDTYKTGVARMNANHRDGKGMMYFSAPENPCWMSTNLLYMPYALLAIRARPLQIKYVAS